MNTHTHSSALKGVEGAYIEMGGETFYQIKNVDQMPAFFVSVVSDQDHWLFAGSTGGLTTGRVSPDTALFPYVTVDKVYESSPHTGPKSIFRVTTDNQVRYWEPYNAEHDDRYSIERNLYKNTLGNALCFEEINYDLNLKFQYTWRFSGEFGIVREAQLTNTASASQTVEFIDGLQNILPAGTPRFTQAQSSNLVDAYKWTELDESNGLALYTLYSAITDRAEPVEALHANTVFHFGLADAKVHLDNASIDAFKTGQTAASKNTSRGVRSHYLINAAVSLAAGEKADWTIVADLEKDQAAVIALQSELTNIDALAQKLTESIQAGSDNLARIMARADGFQATGQPDVSLHHYANTLFNVLRGGIFANQYQISRRDLLQTIKHFNAKVYAAHAEAIRLLPEWIEFEDLLQFAEQEQDMQLSRLIYEYLPITFGRRHGDPSRPWNQFAIELKDSNNQPLLSYQGNWRDIFQNWEALTLSYPSFIESVIAKFVNASTVDGYNPYRITKQGIDWEVEEPDDPWSYIGYWGDHQIIYLLKLLESSNKFDPSKLKQLLTQQAFSYANVPYRLKPYAEMVKDPKATVLYDNELASEIEQRVATIGADGKLVLTSEHDVYRVTLTEKLLVPLLTKLSNLVIDGGIWLNTQRPEWNDANNALVGQGLSMVTLYYMNRYIDFMESLFSGIQTTHSEFTLTTEVANWLTQTTEILSQAAEQLNAQQDINAVRFDTLKALGELATEYRANMYQHNGDFTQVSVETSKILSLLAPAKQLILRSVHANLSDSGLYHAYNILRIDQQSLSVGHLYDMLEGQVAALSSGALSAQQSIEIIDQLFASDIYRPDQKTFMLYPDRTQQRFLDKNTIPSGLVDEDPLVVEMQARGDNRLVKRDLRGDYRFNSALTNANAIKAVWPELTEDYPNLATESSLQNLLEVYESVFNHSAFTGRSGGMFGFEGLGCIYWHMVSKLLLAVQEVAVDSFRSGEDESVTQRLIARYYDVREGIGFNKSPSEYGAFPADPYSHTPKHAGAQQPGMTGQVKEEVITRMGELGCWVDSGKVNFQPFLLREVEFTQEPTPFRYLDLQNQWQSIELAANQLGFTWCQVPIIFTLDDSSAGKTHIHLHDGSQRTISGSSLDQDDSRILFHRTGEISQIEVVLSRADLYQPA
ncbi:hypothetical protein QTP81_07005 [Alteromonas sp. ASW11-36]|uniref:Uncharacterized protein n=1 Tax=Alteromonas arenosi TaxID=3055817 RepID=A0ABT7SW19_9ALTE|nr:hypothetical protein [Alteromonas sp. ASW11-36]MDM7860340.1 hypothetical protein [Alteromonas sp. ASW11-36]